MKWVYYFLTAVLLIGACFLVVVAYRLYGISDDLLLAVGLACFLAICARMAQAAAISVSQPYVRIPPDPYAYPDDEADTPA